VYSTHQGRRDSGFLQRAALLGEHLRAGVLRWPVAPIELQQGAHRLFASARSEKPHFSCEVQSAHQRAYEQKQCEVRRDLAPIIAST